MSLLLVSRHVYQQLISLLLQPTGSCPHMYNCQDARWQLLAMCRQSPDGYSEATSDSLADTEAFIKWVQQLHDNKIHAVVTPRFVPTCTPELLQGLGQLAAHFDTPIQSHISESFDEVLYMSQHYLGPESSCLPWPFPCAYLLYCELLMVVEAHG